MKNVIKYSLFVLLVALVAIPATAQRSRESNYVTVQISPDNSDWSYKTKQDVTFTIAVMKDTYPQKNVEVEWEWGPDMLAPTSKGTINTGTGYKTLKVKGMEKPGFMTLRGTVTVDGVKYSNYTTVAFDPSEIKPYAKLPADFQKFWSDVLERARRVELEPVMTFMPEYSTTYADVYHIRFQNSEAGRFVYGILSIPKGEGPFPAVLRVPGAGVRGYRGDQSYTQSGVINLEIGIHGIPVNMPEEVYLSLRNGALRGYNAYNYDNRDTYYYKHVYAGCVRAVDFLTTLPKIDSDRLGVYGGSQGGALAIITASLDTRIKYLCSEFPALSDIAGYYHGGTGGWPHFFRNPSETNIETKVKVSEYYDVVNFARFLKAPVLYSVGYNDAVCPPTSLMAVYNTIPGEKIMNKTNDTGHWRYPEAGINVRGWLIQQLKK